MGSGTRPLLALALLVAVIGLCVVGSSADRDLRGSDTWVATSDGKRLRAYVLQPPAEERGPWPTIFIYTSYGARVYRDAVLGQRAATGGEGEAGEDPLFGASASRIFAYVFVDRRGRNESAAAWYEGCPSVGKDGAETVAWIAGQEFCDGNIGAFGRSSDGVNPLLTAAERPPALKAVAASVARMTDDYSHYYPGGVLEEAYLALLDGAWPGSWETITSHPRLDSWWEQRVAEQTIAPETIAVPVLLQTGWWDHNLDFSISGFRLLRDHSPAGKLAQLVIGPWSHSTSGALQQGEVEFPEAESGDKMVIRRFFDRWLRGIDNGIEPEGQVHYYQMGRERWVTAQTWPPETVDRVLYLRSNRGLSVGLPGEEPPDHYTADPANPSPSVGGPIAGRAARFPSLILGPAFQDERVLAGRTDYLVYDSPPLDEDLAVAGSVRLDVFISCDRPDTDVAVRLCDFDPTAPERRKTLLVMTGIRRMRYRDSMTSPTPMQPDAVYKAEIAMDPVAYTWRKGHRVRIIVSSSNYPLYAVNPNNGEDFVWQPGAERVAAIEVFRDAHHPSTLVLPVLGQPSGEATGIDHSQTRRQGTDENH